MAAQDAIFVPLRPRYLWVKLLVALFLALKLVSLLSVNVFTDEAYYWMWGQHPALSYYDHPPLNAWLLGLADLLFGRSVFALRSLNILTVAGTVWLFRIWAEKFGGTDWEGLFWRSLLIYFATPAFGAYGTVGTSDHLLVFLTLASGHFFVGYFTAVREDGSGRLRDLYLGALFLGLCGLTKYNVAFMGLALVGFVVSSRGVQRQLLNPHLYLAALFSIAIASPVLIWNAQHDFASFSYHLVDRHGPGFLESIRWNRLVEFLLTGLVALGPFLIWGIARFLATRTREPMLGTLKGLAGWVFWVSTISFSAIALTDLAYFWWNLPAVILMMPLMGRSMGRIALWGHVVLSGAISVLYVVSATIFPLLLLVDLPDPTRTRYFGWEQIEAPLKAAIERYHPDFIGSSRWEYASLAGFVLDDPDTVSIDPKPNQYHYWFDPAAHRGQTAVLLTHSQNTQMATINSQFDKVTMVEEVPVIRFGRTLGTYRIYLGEGFKPTW
jgi:4-amino-4-deoxy-L-arabinose transferase-like glycosyltransferase